MIIEKYNYVIVGSGFLGSVIAERIASQLKQPVLVLEKRNHIGGNCYSKIDETTGIEYHKYGTHIFHTSNEKVWNYINEFTTFNSYRHQVLANIEDTIYQLPINLETINSFFKVNLKPFEVEAFLETKRDKNITNPKNFEEKALATIGKDLYEAFFKGYSKKQWQINPVLLPQHIFSRLPIRTNYNENYFFDKWQGIPTDGYTRLFENMLSNKLINLKLNCDFFEVRKSLNPDAIIIYSGPIDKFFDYKFGALDWRTLSFKKEIKPYNDYQGNSVINFPQLNIPYTRIHEPKHLHLEREYSNKNTLVIKEYSSLDDGSNPYYPILTLENQKKYELYKLEAKNLSNTYIAGRLGDYKYYDMHETIARALEIFENSLLKK